MIYRKIVVYHEIAQILLVGESGVGKKSLYYRYFSDEFYESPIGIPFFGKEKEVRISKMRVLLMLWIANDSISNRINIDSSLDLKNGIVFAFDLSSYSSFANLHSYIENYNDTIKRKKKKIARTIVGCKCDLLQKEVPHEAILKLSEHYNIPYCEVSCKENIGVIEMFTSMAQRILDLKIIY